MSRSRHRVLLVSDFFHPGVGGVESHLRSVAAQLAQRGHHVVVLTHGHGSASARDGSPARAGVRVLRHGVKVYHMAHPLMYNGTTNVSLYTAAVFRDVVVRERITLVHGHVEFSSMAMMAMRLATVLGVPTVFTSHSLFGFVDVSNVLMVKAVKWCLASCHHIVCVSHTAKENLVLRSHLHPSRFWVIPNAIDAADFAPAPERRAAGRVTVVFAARLTHRKGVALLAHLIPRACAEFPLVDFVVAGDGPMRADLERVVAHGGLLRRVSLLGEVPHNRMRDVLVRGDIFLNTSLTEAFCIAIVEAASCGLFVVSTSVGGIPEVLPDHLCRLAAADPDAMWAALRFAVEQSLEGRWDVGRFHADVAALYRWDRVAERLERVYDAAAAFPRYSHLDHLKLVYGAGVFFGLFIVLYDLFFHLFYFVLELLYPAAETDVAPSFDPADLGNSPKT